MNKLLMIYAIIVVIFLVILYYTFLKKLPLTQPITGSATSAVPVTTSGTVSNFVVYSAANYGGTALSLQGAGTYPLTASCASGTILPFKPRSCKLPAGYKIGIQGYYGNPGDTTCGPSISWVTSNFDDMVKTLSEWVYQNVNGSVVIAAV